MDLFNMIQHDLSFRDKSDYFRPGCRWTLSCTHTIGMILRHCLPLANLVVILQLTLPGTYVLNDYEMLYYINFIKLSLQFDKRTTHNSLDNQRIR